MSEHDMHVGVLDDPHPHQVYPTVEAFVRQIGLVVAASSRSERP
jgi:hypothetical protein